MHTACNLMATRRTEFIKGDSASLGAGCQQEMIQVARLLLCTDVASVLFKTNIMSGRSTNNTKREREKTHMTAVWGVLLSSEDKKPQSDDGIKPSDRLVLRQSGCMCSLTCGRWMAACWSSRPPGGLPVTHSGPQGLQDKEHQSERKCSICYLTVNAV